MATLASARSDAQSGSKTKPRKRTEKDAMTTEPNQIGELRSMITALFEDLKRTLAEIEVRLRNIENITTAELAVLRERVERLERDINGIGEKVARFDNDLDEAKFTIKILKWLLAGATSIIVALIIAYLSEKIKNPAVP